MATRDEKRILLLLDRISEVCPLPEAVGRVVELTNRDNTNINQIADAIVIDPGLATECLRIANSAVYRRAAAVDSLHQAIFMLGLDQIREMATGMALMRSFPTAGDPVATRFQNNAVISASLAAVVANDVAEVGRDTAYLAGLLSEVGALSCLAVDGKRYRALINKADGSWEHRAFLERHIYTLTSWEIGERLLKRNEVPATICKAVGMHFDADDEDWTPLGQVTIFARLCTPELRA